jgi:hypothetical protein
MRIGVAAEAITAAASENAVNAMRPDVHEPLIAATPHDVVLR